jgi:6-phosphogluconolactonase/glucosamine-6-phosphate isomerase/deaminase
MHTEIVPSLAEPVGRHWQTVQSKFVREGQFFVAAPLSSTPVPVYSWVLENSTRFLGWEAVSFVLMDEQVDGQPPQCEYIAVSDPASYESFAHRNFLDELRRRTGTALPVIKPDLHKVGEFHTPVNLLILALGVKGNFANVMPGTPLSYGWHIAELTEDFKTSHTSTHSNSYAGASFRNYGMSMGPQQVLEADEVVVIISGEKKKALYKELAEYRQFSAEFPLSVIYHPKVSNRVTVYVTTDVVT